MTDAHQPSEGRHVAAFDFDGTLTRRDTLTPFLVRTCGAGRVARALVGAAPATIRARRGGEAGAHRDVIKARMLRDLFEGRPAAELAEAGRAYAAGLGSRLRPEMMEKVDWHRRQGHELVIVSASLLAYLVPFGVQHGFDQVIGVELEADAAGLLTGRLVGPNVRGPEKEVRLRAWLGEIAPSALWAYGNSSGDAELLAMAHHPTWIN